MAVPNDVDAGVGHLEEGNGVFGQPRVNVLKANLALDAVLPAAQPKR